MAEAVVSLERSTPLAASRMRKQGLTDTQTMDTMFAMGMTGDDYTRVLGLDKSAIQSVSGTARQNMSDILNTGGTVPSQNPVALQYYSQLLGSASNDPTTISSLDKAARNAGVINGEDLLNNQVIETVVEELGKIYPPSLANMAVTGKSAKPDIVGVKIAMAADATRGVKMQRIALEIGEQLPEATIQSMTAQAARVGMDPDKYKSILGAHTGQLSISAELRHRYKS